MPVPLITSVHYLIIQSLETNKASRPMKNKLMIILRNSTLGRAPISTHAYQASYDSSIFPDDRKAAPVHPMPLNGLKSLSSSYHPILILPVPTNE